MDLQSIALDYRERFFAQYAHRLTADQRRALDAICHCRTDALGEIHWRCQHCEHQCSTARSCGHRSCPRCQNHDTTEWLHRQTQKLLPITYFMVTFTLPAELRPLAKRHPKTVYRLLIEHALGVCRDFALRDRTLRGEIGQCAVLHTQTRRLDFHPHVHVVIPGGAIDRKRRCWRIARNHFLFSHKALATVFRARLLEGLTEANIALPIQLPRSWVVDCTIGSGLPALQYLSRYLYRGVISERQLIADDGERVTFAYREGGSSKRRTRTVTGEHFLWLILQHVLPRGFHRVRSTGFLHGNAKATLRLVQWCLRVALPENLRAPPQRPTMPCPCGAFMHVSAIVIPRRTGYG